MTSADLSPYCQSKAEGRLPFGCSLKKAEHYGHHEAHGSDGKTLIAWMNPGELRELFASRHPITLLNPR